MSRLTKRTEWGIVGNNDGVENFPLYLLYDETYSDHGLIEQCFNKLADYEDAEEKESQWIPCSERLPGEYDYPEQRYRVLVSCSDGIVRNATIKSMLSGENHFCSGYEFVYEAWMPLPEPYKESED